MYRPHNTSDTCERIIAHLVEISNTTNCNNLTDEQLAFLRQSFGAASLEHQGVTVGLLFNEILRSSHPVPKLAEICYLAQVPITDTYFKAQLEQSARVTFDDEHRILKYDDGGSLVFGVSNDPQDYEESIRIFLLKTVDESSIPITLDQLFDAYRSLTFSKISIQTFENVLAILTKKILETSGLETKAKFCFIMGAQMNPSLLEEFRKFARVQLNEANQIESLQFLYGGDHFSREMDSENFSKSSTPRLEVVEESESSEANADVESFAPYYPLSMEHERSTPMFFGDVDSEDRHGFRGASEDRSESVEHSERISEALSDLGSSTASQATSVILRRGSADSESSWILGTSTTSKEDSRILPRDSNNITAKKKSGKQRSSQNLADYEESLRIFLLKKIDEYKTPISLKQLFDAYNASSILYKPMHTFRKVFKLLTEEILGTSGLETKIKFCFVMSIQVHWNLLNAFRKFAKIRINDANQIEALKFKYGGDSFSGQPVKPRGRARIWMEKDSDYEGYLESESEEEESEMEETEGEESQEEPEDVSEESEAEAGESSNPVDFEPEDVVIDGTFDYTLQADPEIFTRLEGSTTSKCSEGPAVDSADAMNVLDIFVTSEGYQKYFMDAEDVPASEIVLEDATLMSNVILTSEGHPITVGAWEDVTNSENVPEDSTSTSNIMVTSEASLHAFGWSANCFTGSEAVLTPLFAPEDFTTLGEVWDNVSNGAPDSDAINQPASSNISIETEHRVADETGIVAPEAPEEASEEVTRSHPAQKRPLKIEPDELVEHQQPAPKIAKQEPPSPGVPAASSAHPRVVVKQEVFDYMEQQRAAELAETTVIPVASPTTVGQVRVKGEPTWLDQQSEAPQAPQPEPHNTIPFNLDLVREEVVEEVPEIKTPAAHLVLKEMSEVLHGLLGQVNGERFQGTLRAWSELIGKIRTLGGQDIDVEAVGQAFKSMIEKKLVSVPITNEAGVCVNTFLDQLLRETKIKAVFLDGPEETVLWKVLKRAIKEKRNVVYSGEVFSYNAINRCFSGIVSTLEILL